MKTLVSSAALAICAASFVAAQTPEAGATHYAEQHDVIKVVTPGDGKDNMMFERGVIVPDAVEFVSAEASVAGKTVKGSPYSAEAVTESVQTLADGNRIVSKSSATTYRDSEGRTRREMTLSMPGVPDPPSFITINDPVANVSYHLETKAKIARKLPVALDGMSFGIANATPARVMRAPGVAATGGAGLGAPNVVAFRQIHDGSGSQPKTEPLGRRAIDGVEADGSRTIVTIPAGAVGNEREIQIVTERWYSPELQTLVLSKHTDPRVGETTYTLTNIKRAEPHPSLFQVPADYTMANEEGSPGVRVFRRIERK